MGTITIQMVPAFCSLPKPMVHRDRRLISDALYAMIPPFRNQDRFPGPDLAARRSNVFQRPAQHGILFPVEFRRGWRVRNQGGVGLRWCDGDVEVGVLSGVEDVQAFCTDD
jgi:hypothetical protein